MHRHLRRHALVIFARESFLNIPVSHSKNLSRHPIISHFGLRWDLHFHMVNVHCSLFAWHSAMKKKFFLVRIIWTEIQRELSIPICVIVNLCILVKATFGEPPHLRHYIRSREIIKLQTVKFPNSEEAQQRSIGWSSLSLWWLESIVGLFRAHKQTFLVWNFSPSSSARAHALKQKKSASDGGKLKCLNLFMSHRGWPAAVDAEACIENGWEKDIIFKCQWSMRFSITLQSLRASSWDMRERARSIQFWGLMNFSVMAPPSYWHSVQRYRRAMTHFLPKNGIL